MARYRKGKRSIKETGGITPSIHPTRKVRRLKRKMSKYYLIVSVDTVGPRIFYRLKHSKQIGPSLSVSSGAHLNTLIRRTFLTGKKILDPLPDPRRLLKVELTERETSIFKNLCKYENTSRKWREWERIAKEKDPLKKLEELLPKYILREKLEK